MLPKAQHTLHYNAAAKTVYRVLRVLFTHFWQGKHLYFSINIHCSRARNASDERQAHFIVATSSKWLHSLLLLGKSTHLSETGTDHKCQFVLFLSLQQQKKQKKKNPAINMSLSLLVNENCCLIFMVSCRSNKNSAKKKTGQSPKHLHRSQ